MIVKYMLDDGAYVPTYSHKSDAGMDFRTPFCFALDSNEQMDIDTGVHLFIDPGYHLKVVPKSGLAKKYGLTIINSPGIIDSGFNNSIHALLYNTGKNTIYFLNGDKICQGILEKNEYAELVEVNEAPVTERGMDGLGSTGR